MSKSNQVPPIGLGVLADGYDAVLCDIWGVVHDGVTAFPPAVEALRLFRERGGTVVLVTNAPRPADDIAGQLESLGVSRAAYDAIVTSGDVTAALMIEHIGRTIYHLGPDRDVGLFARFEALTGRPAARVAVDEADYAVCTGLFEDEIETPDDYRSILETMLRRRMPMICANPDLIIHRGGRVVYCAGALGARYAGMGGETHYAGKPHLPIYETSLRRLAEIRRRPIAPSRVLAIGDAIHTDMTGAAAMGLDAAFVAGGIHARDLLTEDRSLDADAHVGLMATLSRRPVATWIDLAW